MHHQCAVDIDFAVVVVAEVEGIGVDAWVVVDVEFTTDEEYVVFSFPCREVW